MKRRSFFAALAGAVGLSALVKRAPVMPAGIVVVDEPATFGMWNLTRHRLPEYPAGIGRYAGTFDREAYIRLCQADVRSFGVSTFWGVNR